MRIPIFHIDFNEFISTDEILLSKDDWKKDLTNTYIKLHEGMDIFVVMKDFNQNGIRDDLVAKGKSILNKNNDWSKKVKWSCKINENGIMNFSDVLSNENFTDFKKEYISFLND